MKSFCVHFKIFNSVVLLALLSLLLPMAAAGGSGESVLQIQEQWTGDYDQLKGKGAIRVLVPLSNPFFFVDGFKKYGIIPQAISRFQNYLNSDAVASTGFTRVIIVPVSREGILDKLVAGYGDIAVANLTITEERLTKVAFANPVVEGVSEIIVAAGDSPTLSSINDLSGKKVYTRKSSSYYEHLLRLNRKFSSQGKQPVRIELLRDELEDDAVLAMVNEKILPYVVIDHRKIEWWRNNYTNVVSYPDIRIDENGKIAWALRKDSPQLLKLASGFSKLYRANLFDSSLIKKETEKEVVSVRCMKEQPLTKFLTYYPLFERVANEYELPPLLLAAIAFEMSGFDETKVDANGKKGMMQLAPFIAREMMVDFDGAEALDEVEFNLTATARYFAYLRENYFTDVADNSFTMMNFVVAAYLNGPEKISTMRFVTSHMGMNDSTWFGGVNVTVARLIGRETVRQVRNIVFSYIVYEMAVESGKIVLPGNIQ